MKLTVLIDNNTLIDRYLLGEPGVSYFIEADDKKLLFDTGYSDAFIRNAQKLNINLLDIDHVVLSHAHLDHTWGLDPLIKLYTEAQIEGMDHSEPDLIAHPLIFNSRTYCGLQEIGTLLSTDKLSKFFSLRLSSEPLWITENAVFLGEIPRRFDFEHDPLESKIIIDGKQTDDEILDDTALAIKTENGLVIVTGCSHSGICNIIEYAKEVCNEDKIVDIIGGFHLQNPPDIKMRGTVDYFRDLNVKEVHACHCTDLGSKIELAKVCDLKEVGCGLQIEYK
ncbi:MBL fold metallo-hydrolase [Methanolobus bombayensis]|uniref:MBL fold metallo-hydrolase n=1 Tax=Methanolobus bombayensis TaxID=38023 RepID=UPI001AEA714B|nr:MBL fold metallo-hydrolase [Methanolobus bombayensis]MBP1910706.1 7,8-dihydropterin-6-yl-methyl-4-(beta-D-ribofuranosyl)aminobenzene 5'-phosphate synthase [Methanolobus bombayensis]